jgi:carbon monoxide dehydrogenase subunit G
MPQVTVGIDIEAGVDRVWDALADLASHGEWMADVDSISFEGAQTAGVGTTFVVATKLGPLRTEDVMTVTTWEPGRVIGVEHRGIVTGIGEFRLQPLAGVTRVTWSEELRFPRRWGGTLTAYVAAPVLALVWRRNLARLNTRLEVRPPSA